MLNFTFVPGTSYYRR